MSGIDSFDIIKSPVLTEKATDLKELRNQICFKVDDRANKRQVATAIEKVFGVKVTGVRILNTPKKPKSLGKQSGSRGGYKKAFITLKTGDKIDLFEKVT